MQVTLAGESLLLDRDRAMFWPRRRTLIVADVHLGKGSAFRRAGVAIPSGSTRDDLERLSALIETYAAERLLVLGDLFHAPLLASEPWLDDVDAFRLRHSQLDISVIRGNHDRVDGVPQRWRLNWQVQLSEPPLLFMHDAQPSSLGHALGGHLHPVTSLRSGGDRLRLPVFWLRERVAVLPSFGAFTGGYPIRAEAGDRVIAVTPERLIAIA
ncbi:ligase-associated DNA damage response endonuclease PdeM [Hydrocarboniphaga sp.]|uniref:ligase-associated DNA damage response endonuclease PdeM n=1 Tax=Hydrocarboniphaga sp. TaxID=2033016 RepID=UPI003D0E0FB2